MSWRTQVYADGDWVGNALRFATEGEAHAYGRDLFLRWTMAKDVREVEVDEPPTHAWDFESGKTYALKGSE